MEEIKHPYKVPNNYFETLEQQILSQINISNLVAKDEVPDQYFKKLEESILSKTVSKPVFSIYKTIKFRYAASIGVFVGLGFLAYFNFYQSPFDKLSNTEIATYLEMENLAEDELSTNVPSLEGDALSSLNLSASEINDYLN